MRCGSFEGVWVLDRAGLDLIPMKAMWLCFYSLRVLIEGVLVVGALQFGVCIRAPGFSKFLYIGLNNYKYYVE